MQRLARLAIQRRWLVIVGWLAFIVIAQAISGSLGGANYKDTFSLPGTETDSVMKLLKDSGQDNQTGLNGQVVLHAKSGDLQAPPANVVPELQQLCSDKLDVVGVTSPWASFTCANNNAAQAPAEPTQLSSDKTIAIVNVTWKTDKYEQKLFDGVYDNLKKLNSSTLQVEFTGDGFQGQGQKESGIPPFLLGFIAALIILAIVFRTFGATALPLASAIAALTSGLGLIGILSHIMSVSNITPQLTELMVIGVGVDYALFIVTRHRRNLRRGLSVPDSISAAINTSGRAVLFAGTTVCIAMLGLTATGVSFFYGMAIGTAIAVALTMIASVTLLPALLSLLGLKVLPRKQRAAVRAGQFEDFHAKGFWARWSEFVANRRAVTALAGLVVMVALAIPFFSMRMGHADQGNDRSNTTTRKGYDLIAQGFGKGYNSTLTLVVSGQSAPQTAQKVSSALKAVPDVDPASVVTGTPLTPTLNLISFKSTTSPQDVKTDDLVKNLRNDVLPGLYKGTPDHVYVYGQTAIYVDFAKVLTNKLPLFIGAVVGLSFLLLLVAFRSLVIPLTAAVMNLLAAGASFGLIVAIFQWGWGSEALGIGKGAPIESWAPVMFFAILFGLSMDYQVFLVSRMHEEWVHSRDNRRAITVGQAETGGIITAAAFIMITVFFGFILDPNRGVKLFGAGLASAVFLDAFVLRTVLVPSLMHMFGKANWFFPKALDKITPHVSIDAEDAAEARGVNGGARPDEPDEVYTRV
ncbi:MAG TPA: MMPL family transporter [Jatrophihabitantaceae bacterium]|jgi:RND superfamily putative drug exporter